MILFLAQFRDNSGEKFAWLKIPSLPFTFLWAIFLFPWDCLLSFTICASYWIAKFLSGKNIPFSIKWVGSFFFQNHGQYAHCPTPESPLSTRQNHHISSNSVHTYNTHDTLRNLFNFREMSGKSLAKHFTKIISFQLKIITFYKVYSRYHTDHIVFKATVIQVKPIVYSSRRPISYEAFIGWTLLIFWTHKRPPIQFPRERDLGVDCGTISWHHSWDPECEHFE